MVRASIAFNLTANSGTLTFPDLDVRAKSIVLDTVNVTCDTSAHAIALNSLYIDLPFLGLGQIFSNTYAMNGNLPIYLSGAQTVYCPKIEFNLSENIGNSVKYSIYSSDGTLIDTSQVTEVNLLFSFDKV